MTLSRYPCYRCDRLKTADEIAGWHETFSGPSHCVKVKYFLCLDCMERDHPANYRRYLDSHEYAQRRAQVQRERRRVERERAETDAELQRRIEEAVARLAPQLPVARRAYTVTDYYPGLEPPEPARADNTD